MNFATFAVAFGALLALAALIAAWLFRVSSAPLWLKLSVPSIMVVLACATPFAVAPMMGRPVPAALASLPERAELVAFVPHDDSHLVDLWLLVDDTPRAYEVVLDESMKKTLRAAQGEMAAGRPAFLKKQGSGDKKVRSASRGDFSDLPDDQTEFVLDESVFSTLPPKEGPPHDR